MQGRRRSHVRLSNHRASKAIDILPTSCEDVDYEAGKIRFKNGRTVTADLIIGADGIRVCES